MGARIGKNVHIAANVWIDPLYTKLLTIEDNVFIGLSAKIMLHEFRIDTFRVGKVILRKGAFIGGFALIGCGVEIGEGATVAAESQRDSDHFDCSDLARCGHSYFSLLVFRRQGAVRLTP